MIIGIGGVSTAGKTTLTMQLRKCFAGKTISSLCQDDYVKPIEQIPQINNRINWEHPDSIDHEKFRQAIIAHSKAYDVVIAEGLVVFHEQTTLALFHKRIYIEIDFKTFRKRKAVDKRWGYEPQWYIRHIWDSFLMYGQIPEDQKEYLVIDGTIPFETHIISNYLSKP
jgi:nicotinamide/nicotinate riboside kinase